MSTHQPFVIVTSEAWSSCTPASSWRQNLIGVVEQQGVAAQLLPSQELDATVLEQITPRAVIIEDPADVSRLATHDAWRANSWLPLFPSAAQDWPQADKWIALAKRYASDVTGFLTDHEVSRDAIERALADRRVEVVVLQPSLYTDGSTHSALPNGGDELTTALKGLVDLANVPRKWKNTNHWSFAASKVLPADAFNNELDTWQGGKGTRRSVDRVPQLVSDPSSRSETRRLIGAERPKEPAVRAAVLGPQLTFIDQLANELTRQGKVTVQSDQWKYLSGPGGGNERTDCLLKWAETVVAEWARPSASWIQANASSSQRLIVRAHRYEITTDFPNQIDMERYSAGVCITPWVGRALVQEFSWPAEKMVFIPNYVDGAHFQRPKLPGAEFTLGMVGIRPTLKRVDLALDLLEELRQRDTRFNLRIRGPLPPGKPNWDKYDLREQWGLVEQRIRESPHLRGAVFFDGEGRDMGNWYRQIGIILSLSDLEGSHVALAEGVASGAVPVARRWPGIETLWPTSIVCESVDQAVTRCLKSRDAGYRNAWISELQMLAQLDGARVLSAWNSLIKGDLRTAQAHFGPVDWNVDQHQPVRPVRKDDPIHRYDGV